MEGIVHTEREKTWSAMSACAAFALSSMIRNASLFVWDLVYFDRLFPLHVAFGTVCPNEGGLGSEGRTQLRPLIYWCLTNRHHKDLNRTINEITRKLPLHKCRGAERKF